MKIVTPLAICALVLVPLCLLCACGGAGQQSEQGSDMGALYERFRTNAPNDRLAIVDQIFENLQGAIKSGNAANLTSQKIGELLGKPDKEVETIQTDGNILVRRYQLETKPKGGQYQKIDALVLRFKSDILVDVAKQQGWVSKGGK